VSTASQGAYREHKVRRELVDHGWFLVARSAGSKGAADLVMVHPEHGIALVQVGTPSKTLGPDDRTRLLNLAHLCSALPIVAICADRLPIRYRHVHDGPPATWTDWHPTNLENGTPA
jgi:hypothetical protein